MKVRKLTLVESELIEVTEVVVDGFNLFREIFLLERFLGLGEFLYKPERILLLLLL